MISRRIFKISNSVVDQNRKLSNVVEDIEIINTEIDQLQQNSNTGSSGVRNVVVYDNLGGTSSNIEPNGSLIYSFNQSPGQIVIDKNTDSVAIGSEYVILAGVNGVYLQTFRTNDTIQISGEQNTSRVNVALDAYCKCTATKVTATLWIVQGDGLSYLS